MADSTTVNFQFGTIQLGFVKTTNYQELTEFDPAGVNVTLVRHRITVRGVLARNLIPAESGEIAGDVLARLRRYILRARRYLLYGIAGKKIVEVGSSASPDNPDLNIDAANGPKCLWVTATDIAEGGIVIEASFEAALVPCSGTARGILAHTFNQKEDYDSAGYCTVTTMGTIVTRSDLRQDATQLLKDANVPQIRDGYKRLSKSFMLSDNGLKLTYQITDREYPNRPPEGAIEADGQFAIVTGAGGNGAYANVDVSLSGFKEVPQRKLYLLAVEIILAKTKVIRAVDPKTKAPSQISLTVTQDLFENRMKASSVILLDQKKLFFDREEGIGEWNPDLFLGRTFRPKGLNIPSEPVPVNRPEQYLDTSVLPNTEVPRRVEELRDGQLVDMIRAEFNEPCDELVVLVQSNNKPRTPGTLVGGIAGGILDGIIGELQSDGGTAGGGGIGNVFPPDFIPGESSTPRLFTEDIFGALGVVPDLPTLTPLSNDDYPPSLTDLFPPGGTGGEPADPTFGNTGGNVVDNRSARQLSDLPDLDIPYTSYLVSIGHAYDSGKRGTRGVGLPVAGVTPPNPVASVGNPTLTITAAWTAERMGGRPQIPDPDSGDENYVLIAANIKPDEVRRMPGGVLRYIVTGTYVYFVVRPSLSPILDAYPPFLLADVQADARAGLTESEYRTAKGILFGRVRTIPARPFFVPPPTAADVPEVPVPPPAPDLTDAAGGPVLGGDPNYNPSPGG